LYTAAPIIPPIAKPIMAALKEGETNRAMPMPILPYASGIKICAAFRLQAGVITQINASAKIRRQPQGLTLLINLPVAH